MANTYNRIAGQSVERIAALSDGVFAIAMTLLVLDLRVPAAAAVHSDADLWRALLSLLPRLVMFVLSVMTLGIFWIGQQTQLHHLRRADRSLSWIHIVFLGIVSLIPFSTALLAEHTRYRAALVVYWINILLLGSTLYWSWVCALNSGLVKEEISPDISKAVKERILVAQSLYAVGMALCFIDTRLSIAVIVLVQLNFAILTPWSRNL
jgi:uncharacterized membrane protein